MKTTDFENTQDWNLVPNALATLQRPQFHEYIEDIESRKGLSLQYSLARDWNILPEDIDENNAPEFHEYLNDLISMDGES